ncbi:MAG: phospholipid/cholesterol/gamma-HCH transport system substrate-binding protein [Pseudonocardiales bacterium]|jgi:phospholipid/cholesterol/gamma-HCH transport system substrate-binding protein|nr:phospholipid/cholesterol/gamma-HCH transport system substrate-binding protein [Pseudonocardiales bacterium]
MSERDGTRSRADDGPVKTRRTSVGGKPFSSRNPTTIGAIGLVLIAVLLWASFNASKLPIIGGGTTYTAYFTEDAGLRPNDDVRIAGVTVGKVESTALDGSRVKVKFRVKGAFVGDQSTVAIRLKTLLGAKYLGIDSLGTKKQNAKDSIPLARTSSPFDIYPVFTQLTKTFDQINTDQLAKAFGVLSSDFKNTPNEVKPVLSGLSRLSNTIASRDAELQTLLEKARGVTGVLASRDTQLQQLLNDGGLLLDELNARRDAIHSLLVNTTTLSQQLSGLVADNQHTIGPMLDNLGQVLALLQKNQDNLDRSLQLLAPFYRVFANALGNGRWFDNYICNLGVGGITDILLLGNGDGGCKG